MRQSGAVAVGSADLLGLGCLAPPADTGDLQCGHQRVSRVAEGLRAPGAFGDDAQCGDLSEILGRAPRFVGCHPERLEVELQNKEICL